jgi:hypothetical protein
MGIVTGFFFGSQLSNEPSGAIKRAGKSTIDI